MKHAGSWSAKIISVGDLRAVVDSDGAHVHLTLDGKTHTLTPLEAHDLARALKKYGIQPWS